MKLILISIKPKWVAKILNGEKTIEIRKTLPKCKLPIDVYIYCTKGSKKDWHLIEVVDTDTGWEGYEYDYYIGGDNYLEDCLEGKVVAKFTLNKVEELEFAENHKIKDESFLDNSCLTNDELWKYLKDNLFVWKCMDDKLVFKGGTAWYINNLVIFDKPKELSEFKQCREKKCPYSLPCHKTCHSLKHLTKAPQSWCYVEVAE